MRRLIGITFILILVILFLPVVFGGIPLSGFGIFLSLLLAALGLVFIS